MRLTILVAFCAGLAHAAPATLYPTASTTRWSPKLRKPADASDAHLYLRGEKGDDTVSRIVLKFAPTRKEGRTLARARLRVFVPEVRN
ncbi:hypothetical protein HQ560_15530, partial [bacterium]|nr:hypothetical protein [bacterium]